ncbi:hypothetical protein MAMP_02463 [Methylophaga aminisulfidivorans MP]|uniref:Uncharacterized protein n=1 Tax=Methylophaga aminisulfidivorans MP TaxID=1026882 RepID=F5SWK3_9GAMM|nr:hypothetical protein MAMP_02463 [Methylophaga aminisulfidivorans MP]
MTLMMTLSSWSAHADKAEMRSDMSHSSSHHVQSSDTQKHCAETSSKECPHCMNMDHCQSSHHSCFNTVTLPTKSYLSINQPLFILLTMSQIEAKPTEQHSSLFRPPISL